MIARWVRAVGALVLLLVIVFGVPLILIRIAGWPLPSKVPDWSHVVTMVRQGDIRSEVVTKTLAAVVWIAWLQLAWATVWELVVNAPAQSSGRRPPRPAPLVVPTVSVGVGRLVAAILAIGLAVGSMAPVAAARSAGLPTLTRSGRSDAVAAAVAEPARHAPWSMTPVAFVPPASRATWVVGEADTLWDIATAALGDGSHVEQILELNPGLASARHLRQGQHIRLPSGAEVPPDRSPVAVAAASLATLAAPDAPIDITEPLADGHRLVVVQPGDNLWDLIDGEVDTPTTGDIISVAAANDGATTQSGPWVFHADHPEMIHPGQTFDLGPAVSRHTPVIARAAPPVAPSQAPADTTAPTIAPASPTVEHGAPAPDGDDHAAVTPPGAPAVDTPTPDSEATTATPLPVVGPVMTDTPLPAPRPAVPPVAETPASPRVVGPALGAQTDGAVTSLPGRFGGSVAVSEDSDAVPVGELGVAALVAAGAIALLDARRRRALRSAAIGARLAGPRDRDVQTERALRALDEGERLARLDLAVRACALDLARAGARVLAALLAPAGEIRLVTDRPATPTGGAWRLDLDDGSWILPAGVPTAALADAARHAGMPCPALVHLGRSGDGQLYVDLEALGMLVVESDAETGADIVRSLVASVALSPFATTAHLISVGIDADLDVEAGIVVRRADTLDEALALAEHSLGSTRAIGRDTTTFALRAHSNGGEEWEPAVVFAALDDNTMGLDGIVRRTGAGLAVVVAVTRPDNPSGPGNHDHPSCGEDESGDSLAPSEPRRPTNDAPIGDGVASGSWRLFGSGDTFVLRPLGIRVDPCRLTTAALIDVDYLLSSTEEVLGPSHGAISEPRRPAIGPLVDVFGPFETEDIARAQTAGVELNGATGDEVLEVAAAVTDAAVTSVTPLPFVDAQWSLMVRLLGHVDVVAADGTAVAFERSKALELVVWLSQHRQGPTRSGARTALWDLDVRDSTFANVVSDARRALARTVTPPIGEEWLLRTLTEQLPLHDAVLSDVEALACRCAHARGVADPMSAITVLRPGLELVTGMPFAGTSYLWPDAEGITSSVTLLVVTAATELSNRYLQLGDSEGVFWATGQGLKVLAGHEELIALRMRAHHRAGDLAGVRHEWETYERALDADPWSPAHPSPKLVDLRRELLTAAS